MVRNPLNRGRKNELARLVTGAGLHLTQFAWSSRVNDHDSSMRIDILTHQPTGAKFEFGLGWIEWNPDWEFGSREQYYESDNWVEVCERFGRWSAMVFEEHAAPDLWAMAQQEQDLLAVSENPEAAEEFTPSEREQLKSILGEIRHYLLETSQVDEMAAAAINSKVDYLTRAVDRLNRFDFRGVLASTLLGMALEAGLTSAASKAFFAYCATQFSTVFGAIRLLGS